MYINWVFEQLNLYEEERNTNCIYRNSFFNAAFCAIKVGSISGEKIRICILDEIVDFFT